MESIKEEIISRTGDNPQGIFETELSAMMTRPGVEMQLFPEALNELIAKGKVEVSWTDALQGKLLISTKPNKLAVAQEKQDAENAKD